MNCEKAESHLSAYLDDTLDPQLREEIAAHLESCALCSEVVAEYRRFDMLLRDTPRVSPPPELRDRIFGSPQFAAILRRQAKADETPPGVTSPGPHRSRTRGSPPKWSRIVLQSAAVLAIIIGSALLLKQGLFHSSPTTAIRTPTPIIGNINPNSEPLAAGNRVIYEYGGALWSAPENGPGIGEQLTPASITVGTVWSVSPDGSLVAYVEATSGRIHVIRADRLNDVAFSSFSAICTTTASCATPPFLSWSPDGKHIAYQSEDGSLHLVNADGTGDQTIVASEHGVPTALVWSSDSQMLAFVELDGVAESIWNYDLPNNVARQVAASADPSDSAASVDQMFWLQGSGQSTLTWTAWEASARLLTGIFSCPVLQGSCVQNLTPANITLTAAGFTPQESNGTWLLGFTNRTGTPEIATVAVSQPALAIISNAQLQNKITGVYWSPLGDNVALVDSTGQMFLASNTGAPLQQLWSYDVIGTPVWSPDGTHLAAPVQDLGIMSIDIASGSAIGLYHLLPSVPTLAAATMLWSTDSQYLAITSQTGTYLVSSDAKSVKQVDTQTASGPFGWSLSG